jgi:hypothetical protein
MQLTIFTTKKKGLTGCQIASAIKYVRCRINDLDLRWMNSNFQTTLLLPGRTSKIHKLIDMENN